MNFNRLTERERRYLFELGTLGGTARQRQVATLAFKIGGAAAARRFGISVVMANSYLRWVFWRGLRRARQAYDGCFPVCWADIRNIKKV